MVAAQPLFQVARRLIGAEIGISRHRIGAQHNPGIKMHHTFGVEAERLLADRGMAGKSAVEILFERFEDAGADAFAQSLAELDLFAGYAKGHGLPPVAVPNQTPRQPLIQLGTTTEVSMRWFVLIDQAVASLSRRRWTEDGMRMASRYLATVGRAISMPDARSLSTMVSSDNTSSALSASIRCLMRSRTASAE